MSRVEFILLIKSNGFYWDGNSCYRYKNFKIYLWRYDYSFSYLNEVIRLPYGDLTPILKFIRSIKLKALLR